MNETPKPRNVEEEHVECVVCLVIVSMLVVVVVVRVMAAAQIEKCKFVSEML